MSEGLVKGEGFAVDASMIRADASEENAVEAGEPTDWSDPNIPSRPVTEYLDAIDQDGAPRKKISLTDPTARWTAAIGGQARFTWATNYFVDVETSVIVDFEPTPADRKAEVETTQTMIDRTEHRFGLKPRTPRNRLPFSKTPLRAVNKSEHPADTGHPRTSDQKADEISCEFFNRIAPTKPLGISEKRA